MKMRKIALVILTVAGLMCFSPLNGFAFSLYNNYTGNLQFKFTAYDMGTTYSPDGAGSWIPSDGGTAIPDNTYGNADGDQDTEAVGYVTSVNKIPVGNLWSPTLNDALEVHMYGLDDNYVGAVLDTGGNPTGQINVKSVSLLTGAYLDIYIGQSNLDVSSYSNGISTATDGTPFLRLEFVSLNGDVNNTVYSTTFDYSTLHGSGLGYLKVVRGWGDAYWEEVFDSNQYDALATGADFRLDNTFQPSDVVDGSGNPVWLVKADDPVKGYANAVPEPASMLMLGLGILGCASLRRKTAA